VVVAVADSGVDASDPGRWAKLKSPEILAAGPGQTTTTFTSNDNPIRLTQVSFGVSGAVFPRRC
jgi:hypothetical protein